MPKAHIARLESGKIDLRLSTLTRLFDAMFCDALVLPRARLLPGEAIARRRLEPYRGYRWRLWDDDQRISADISAGIGDITVRFRKLGRLADGQPPEASPLARKTPVLPGVCSAQEPPRRK